MLQNSISKMKMKGKSKLKTIEEIPLEELESQVQVESKFISFVHRLCYIAFKVQFRKIL